MYTTIFSILAIGCLTFGGSTAYPIFGTKRYHRTPLVSPPDSSINSPSAPYYNQLSSVGSGPIPITSYQPENGFYYYPTHDYQPKTIYGLPTYHGDYNPKPYYYAPAPKFNYYDDREIISNPMDDLHEEILHEDQRERQRELIPMFGEENWYQNLHPAQNDELTNNFLRNLIEYNRNMDAQEALQLQQQEEEHQRMLLQRDQEHIMKPYNDEYDEYAEIGDYEYEPQPSENVFDIKKYEQLRASSVTEQPKYNEIEDEDVKQLKLLAHHAKNSPMQTSTRTPLKSKYADDYNFEWKEQQQLPNTQYDNEPEEYDDDTWISWDRKRSAPTVGNKWKSSIKKFESIKAFNNRKPLSPVGKDLKDELMLQKLAVLSEATTTIASTQSPANLILPSSANAGDPTPTITSTTTIPNAKGKTSGQKEVVLPRPASVSQQKMFAAPVLGLMKAQVGKTILDQQNALNLEQEDYDAAEDTNDINKFEERKSIGNIYNTIRQLIAMEQQIEKIPSETKIQKRFVTNEDSLVHELDNLKRRST